MHWFWICLAIGLVVIDLASERLFFGYVAIASIITAILSLIFFNESFNAWWQALVFLLLALDFILCVRPLVKMAFKKLKDKNK